MIVFSVYDRKMNTYARPMYVDHLVQVTRSLKGVCDTPGSLLAQYPEDYDLYRLGHWDERTGEFIPEEKPVFILNCKEIKEVPDESERIKMPYGNEGAAAIQR